MTNKQKLFIIIIITATITCLIIGSTFAYWTWSTSSAQATTVSFTVASGFTCSADGGGNLTSSNVQLMPADCTNSEHAIKRAVKVSTVQDSGKTIYLDMNLKVNSIGANLAASENFRYALTTNSTSCHHSVIAEGNFVGATANTEKMLLSAERYTASTANDTYYLWIWLDKEETNLNTMNQTFNMTLSGSCTDEEPTSITTEWGQMVDRYTKVNFSQTSVTNGTNGLYMLKQTVNDTHPVYYYRGNISNNNVLFGAFCWKIVRTTSTGGTKLIYNGVPVSGECTATTGEGSRLAVAAKFNANDNSLSDAGYMYGVRYESLNIKKSNLSTSYKYGNSITYDGTNYHLVDTINSTGTWENDYNTLNNNHYTCFNTSGICSSVYYVYYTLNSSNGAYYITLTGGKTVETAIDEMLASSTNVTNSTIKTAIDNWYSTNLTSYTSYLEDVIWCNDRSIYSLGGFNPNGGNTFEQAYRSVKFGTYGRMNVYYSPSVTCKSINDSFTVSNANGNGKLTYPIGLLTADEMLMAGSKYGYGNSNNSFYLYDNQSYWSSSPDSYLTFVYIHDISSIGSLDSAFAHASNYYVRPSISLKSGATWSGSGTSSDPYTVSYS